MYFKYDAFVTFLLVPYMAHGQKPKKCPKQCVPKEFCDDCDPCPGSESCVKNPCPRAAECTDVGGKCLPWEACTFDNVGECREGLCGDCACVIFKKPENPCETSDDCDMEGGKCIPEDKCDPDSAFVDCDASLCDEGCTCAVKAEDPCPTTEECKAEKGECVIKEKCVGSKFSCDDSLCPGSDNCTCRTRAPKPEKCPKDPSCRELKGKCVKDGSCPDEETVDCRDDLCVREDGNEEAEKCVCQINNCKPNKKCKKSGGLCTYNCDPDDESIVCKPWCKGEGCVCQITKVTCDTDEECDGKGGKCVPDKKCKDKPGIDCDSSLCGGEGSGCTCKSREEPPEEE